MKYTQGCYPVIEKKAVARGIFDMTVHCPEIAEIAAPGQFVNIRAEGFSLRRPISICEIDKDKGNIRLVFEVRGEGTAKISEINAGGLIDIIAPLGGNPFALLDRSAKAVTIGGGIGVPPMLALAGYYNNNCTSIIGFRSADAVILKKDFERTGAQTILCTDDGTAGQKGFVTDALNALLSTDKPDIIYACGPAVMLKRIAAIAKEHNIHCQVSLEERMGCGVGACLVCACRTIRDGEEFYAHVCKDGPVFEAEEVMNDE